MNEKVHDNYTLKKNIFEQYLEIIVSKKVRLRFVVMIVCFVLISPNWSGRTRAGLAF